MFDHSWMKGKNQLSQVVYKPPDIWYSSYIQECMHAPIYKKGEKNYKRSTFS